MSHGRRHYRFRSSTLPFTVESRILGPPGLPMCARRCFGSRRPLTVISKLVLSEPFTVDTVRLLKRRYPQHRFIWLLGSDNLPNFHFWSDWRGLAREVPIAVIRRPGYDRQAHAARAMGWLERFVHPPSQASHWTEWSAPAILFLRLPPDATSATAIRAQIPSWHRRFLPAQKAQSRKRQAIIRQETP